MSGSVEREERLLLGQDESRYGEHRLESLAGGRIAVTLSVGGDKASPSRRFKGRQDQLNEDAVYVAAEGDQVVLFCADAHYGLESSHVLARLTRDKIGALLGPTALDLGEVCRAMELDAPEPQTPSETTLLLARLDRVRREVESISYGDSRLAALGPSGLRLLGRENHRFVTAGTGRLLSPPAPVRATLAEDELLLAFTDGIHECHYRHPETSVAERDFVELYRRHGADPVAFARALTELALAGVRGAPGGQDNIALIVVGPG